MVKGTPTRLFGLLRPEVCELLADDVVLEDVELPNDLSDVEVVDEDVLDDCDKLVVDEDVEVGTELEDDVLVNVADEVTPVEDELEED